MPDYRPRQAPPAPPGDLEPVMRVMDRFLANSRATVNETARPVRGYRVGWRRTRRLEDPFWLEATTPGGGVAQKLARLYAEAGWEAWDDDGTVIVKPAGAE